MMKSEIEIKVRGYHLDIFAHVNNARYVEFLEEGRWAALEDSDIAKKIIDSGQAFIVVNINIDYLKPAMLNDLLVLRTNLKRIGNKSITLTQEIFRKKANEPEIKIVSAEVVFVLVDMKTNKAVVVNDEIRGLFNKG